ncbi:tautomerase family protein [Streptomyces sp. NBC_01317]|uniref:tautomerase family protein n=1 Tax=Streptomyces sp. NBC_01317 TaxID=2903822 RepID=UPI002E157D63|nr:tautomerase family protein [Streptomyces sp. NBC_01317]
MDLGPQAQTADRRPQTAQRHRADPGPEGIVMPFVNIDLLRGKSPEYLTAVSDAVHEALVEGLGMFPEDRFQVIHQLAPGELVFSRDFRGGPRSDAGSAGSAGPGCRVTASC